MIPREGAEELYNAEEHATQAVVTAALELTKRTNSPQLGLEDDAVAIELATLLDHFGSAGTRAARLVIERYGGSE